VKISRSSVVWIVKTSPVITNIAVMIGLLCTFLNPKLINLISPNFSAALFTCLGWWMLSKYLGFCFFHQLLIYNLALVSVLVFLQINWLLFNNIVYIRLMLFSTIFSLFCYYFFLIIILKKNRNGRT
jgi:hypothetical protein